MNNRLDPAPGIYGFTLVEMLAVMILMVMIATAGLVTWNGVKRGAEMRTAINDVRASFALARQYAVLKSARIRIAVTNEQAYHILVVESGQLLRGGPMELPLGVRFAVTPMTVEFKPNGSVQNNQNVDVMLVDILNTNNTHVLKLNGLTGIFDYD